MTVAVLDTGVAYANHGRYIRSPDFSPSEFVAGYDFVPTRPIRRIATGTARRSRDDRRADQQRDRRHGTRLWRATDAGPCAERAGQRRATRSRRASTTPSPSRSDHQHEPRVHRRHDHGERHPAADRGDQLRALEERPGRRGGRQRGDGPAVLSGQGSLRAVGRRNHEDGCLAYYSNFGAGLDLVAPGGGDDGAVPGDANCQPDSTISEPDIFQETFAGLNYPNPREFGLPSGYYGTSMAAPHVSATAALVIASGVLERTPPSPRSSRASRPRRPRLARTASMTRSTSATASSTPPRRRHRPARPARPARPGRAAPAARRSAVVCTSAAADRR